MSNVDDDDWPPLTDEDRRGIARIREQLDAQFAAYAAPAAPPPEAL